MCPTNSSRRWLSSAAATVPPYGISEVQRYASRYGSDDMVYMSMGEPDFDTPLHIREAACKAINAGKTHYTLDVGIPELRQAISEKLLKENGVNYPASNIVVVSGSQEGISVLAKALLDPGDEVIMGNPYYPAYFQNVVLQGAKPVLVPLDRSNGYRMTGDAVAKALTPRTKLIVIVSPNNPTGGVQTPEDLQAISEIAETQDLIVVSDEIYEHIVYDGVTHTSISSLRGMKERTIVQNGFSKAYSMTGWRIGYMALPDELISKVEEIHRATVICPPSISQYAALAALRGPQQAVSEMTAEFSRRRNFVVRRLNEIPGVEIEPPKGAFYVFPDFSEYEEDDRKLALDLIREAHVVTVHGSAFGPAGKGHLRISFAASQEKLSEGLDRLEAHLKSIRPPA